MAAFKFYTGSELTNPLFHGIVDEQNHRKYPIFNFIEVVGHESNAIKVPLDIEQRKTSATVVDPAGSAKRQRGKRSQWKTIAPWTVRDNVAYNLDEHEDYVSKASGGGLQINAEGLKDATYTLQSGLNRHKFSSFLQMILDREVEFDNGDVNLTINYENDIKEMVHSGDPLNVEATQAYVEIDYLKSEYRETHGTDPEVAFISGKTATLMKSNKHIYNSLRAATPSDLPFVLNTSDYFVFDNIIWISLKDKYETKDGDVEMPEGIAIFTVLSDHRNKGTLPFLMHRAKTVHNDHNSDSAKFDAYSEGNDPAEFFVRCYDNMIPTPSSQTSVQKATLWSI